ncbi:jerky protein [Anaeramoeba flamelloides]|uniref:Jerky protein n=1 Tax=Anaeramoeba flamelloides TaxID=1746091 RepID=A0AAV7ZY53_9EUKA|nr:jerky protein [Anaeramoeba flamelloides]
MSAVVTISAKGYRLKTLLLIPQKSVAKKVFLENNLSNYAFAHAPKGFINKNLFYKWTRDIFIPEVEAIRTFNNYPKDKWALLVLDGHNSRAELRAIHLLQQHYIDCIVIPGHSSHIVQPLDVGVFKYFKQELKKQQRHKKNFYLVLDHCLNLSTSTMRIVEAFNRAGIYPLNLNKKLNNKPIFPTEIKEFAFTNSNQGSRLKISGQIITGQKFIEQLVNKEKRKKNAQKNASKKHIPPSALFQKLFAGRKKPYNHILDSSKELDKIQFVSMNSSIEQLQNQKINEDNNGQGTLNASLERTENQIEENNSLINEIRDFQNNFYLTRNSNSNSNTLQLQLLRFQENETNIHENFDTTSILEPTTTNISNHEYSNEEILTPLSPGGTSLHSEKNYFRPNREHNRTHNREPNREPNRTHNREQNRTRNRTHNRTQRTPSRETSREHNRTPNRVIK